MSSNTSTNAQIVSGLNAAIASLIEVAAMLAPEAEVKAKQPKAKKAKSEGPSFADLRTALKAHKATGAIAYGVTVKDAIAQGLMDANGNLSAKAPKAEPKHKAPKKGKKAKTAVAAKVEAEKPARRANGTIAPKAEWADRKELAASGNFTPAQIDAVMAANN